MYIIVGPLGGRMRHACLWIALFLASCQGSAQPAPASKGTLPPIAQKTAGLASSQGMIRMHGEGPTSLWEFTPEALGRTYLWSPHVVGGLGSFVLTGQGGHDRVVVFERRGKNLLARQVQTVFTTDPGRPEALGLAENYRAPVIATLPILAETQGSLLVSGEKFLKSFNWDIISHLEQEMKAQRAPDSLRILSHELCPENMEWDLEIDMDLKPDSTLPSMTPLPDPRRVTLGLHWSLRTLPKTGYTPRRADPLVGYFTTTSKNLSRPMALSTSENRIVRWDIRRRNPDIFTTGDVAKPVVYWISKNTPHEFRDVIREGVLEWNRAFEAAGFRGALECKVQPDDATWSLADCRYNVIQWINSHKLHFAGHGPVTENPFTGEILRAHIRIDGECMHGLDGTPALLVGRDCLVQAEGGGLCALACLLPSTTSDASREHLFRQYLKRVVCHEVGHTLGLRHNFKGSTQIPFARAHDTGYTRVHGLTASIMDYAQLNLHPDSRQQGDYFTQTVGAYDVWAIRYGYSHDPQRPEEELLASILKNPLPFGTDEDTNHDPYCAQGDGTDDPLADAARQQDALELGLAALADPTKAPPGDPGLRRLMFRSIIRKWFLYPKSHARFLGGHIYMRGLEGPHGRLIEWTPPRVEQTALESILRPFQGDTFDSWASYLDDLPRLSLYDWSRDDEPPILPFRSEIRGHLKDVVGATLHPEVLNRLQEHALRSPAEGALTQDGLLTAFEKAMLETTSKEHWRRLRAELYVQRLMELDLSSSLNAEGRALVHTRLTGLTEGVLKTPGILGASPESEAMRARILWDIGRHLRPDKN